MSELKDMHHEAEKWVADAKNDDVKARAESCLVTITEIKLIVDKMPSAQPKHIKGRWIQKSQALDTVRGYWATCSSCGRGSFGGGNFCRECGSDNRKVTT